MAENVLFRPDLFKETPSGYVLIGNKCPSCGLISFPKAEFCINCLNENMEEVELSKRGTLYSWTVTRVPVGKFPLPYAIGMITLPEKVRLFAPLVIDKKEFEIGTEMEMEIATLWMEGEKNFIGYKFKAVV